MAQRLRGFGTGLPRARGLREPRGATVHEVLRLEAEARDRERLAEHLLGTGDGDDAQEAVQELLAAIECRMAMTLPVAERSGAALTRLTNALRVADVDGSTLLRVARALGTVGS